MSLADKLNELALLRADWSPTGDREILQRRRIWAAWSNAGIEGNTLSWPDALALIGAPGREGGSSAELEILGCHAGLVFIEDLPIDNLNLALLRHLHALLMRNLGRDVGSFRQVEVRIVRESGPEAGNVVFQPPHPARVPELLETLLLKTNRELVDGEDVFHIAGRFHYEFQSIHPFEDGNGRIGRLLTTLIARQGWASRGFYTAPAVARARGGYYLALRAVRPDYESAEKDGLLPWLLPFLSMMHDALIHPDPER
ncbi:MAG: Fic family protein [bacterium]|nr:Fic family protein [bacterium]